MLKFDKAVSIEHKNFNQGIRDCTYMVRGRTFKDLSCMKGETVVKMDKEMLKAALCKLREYLSREKTMNIGTIETIIIDYSLAAMTEAKAEVAR